MSQSHSELSIDDITIVILAGGKGRRMGGCDKGLVSYKKTTLIQQVINAISLQTDKIIINANRNISTYAAFGYPVIEDNSITEFQGPLAGFLAAMKSVNTAYILTLPCDSPVIPEDYMIKMKQGLCQSNCQMAIATDGENIQPVYALMPINLLHNLSEFLAGGGRKAGQWLQQQNFTLVEFSSRKNYFININTPQELQKLS